MGISGPLPEHVLRLMSEADRTRLGTAGLTANEATLKAQKRFEREEQRIFALELTRLELPFYWHRTDKPTGAIVGVPDFIIGVRGTTLWVEFKAQGKSLSPDQEQFRVRLANQSILLHICRNAAEAIKLLRNL